MKKNALEQLYAEMATRLKELQRMTVGHSIEEGWLAGHKSELIRWMERLDILIETSENKQGVTVTLEARDIDDYISEGYWVGRTIIEKVPVFTKIKWFDTKKKAEDFIKESKNDPK